MFRLTADKIAQMFGVRKHKRIRGKLHSMVEKLDHGHHVLRVYCESLVARMYEKFATFLRVEICVNRLKDLGLNKGLENLNALRQKLVAATDRMAGFEAELLNVHVDFPLFQRLALPIPSGRTKIPGIKIQDARMMRLMEVLHGGPQLGGWRMAQVHEAIRTAFDLPADAYTLNQLRYDVRRPRRRFSGDRHCTPRRTSAAQSNRLTPLIQATSGTGDKWNYASAHTMRDNFCHDVPRVRFRLSKRSLVQGHGKAPRRPGRLARPA